MKLIKIIYFIIFLVCFSPAILVAAEEVKAVTGEDVEVGNEVEKKVAERPDFTNYSAKLQRKYGQRYDEISENDLDGDGKVDVGELKERAKKRALKMDLNEDGVITESEIDAYADLYIRETMLDPDNKKGNKIIERKGKVLKRKLKKMDLNKDGKITPEEIEEYQSVLMKKRDKDGDGVLDFKEYRTDTERNKSSNRKNKKKEVIVEKILNEEEK